MNWYICKWVLLRFFYRPLILDKNLAFAFECNNNQIQILKMNSSHDEASERSHQSRASDSVSIKSMNDFKIIQSMCAFDTSYVVAEKVLEQLNVKVVIIIYFLRLFNPGFRGNVHFYERLEKYTTSSKLFLHAHHTTPTKSKCILQWISIMHKGREYVLNDSCCL